MRPQYAQILVEIANTKTNHKNCIVWSFQVALEVQIIFGTFVGEESMDDLIYFSKQHNVQPQL